MKILSIPTTNYTYQMKNQNNSLVKKSILKENEEVNQTNMIRHAYQPSFGNLTEQTAQIIEKTIKIFGDNATKIGDEIPTPDGIR